MRIAIIQHEASTPPGSLLEWCIRRQVEFEVFKLWKKLEFPDCREFAGIVICGGSMNVDQETIFPWLKQEKETIRSFLDQQVKTLGLCLGAQMIADVLGGPVQAQTDWEVGWHQIKTDESFAKKYHVSQNLMAFQWHKYNFSPSPNYHISGSNDHANQILCYKDLAVGFQFHPESSLEWVLDNASSAKNYSGPYVMSSEDILSRYQQQILLQTWFFQFLDHFFLPQSTIGN